MELSARLKLYTTTTMDQQSIEMLLNPHLLVQNYILLPEGQSALSFLLSFLSTLITSGIPWGSGVSERSHGPLIVTGPAASTTYDGNFPVQGFGGKAIIFAPFEHSKTLLVAVPADVKEAHYDSLARGWVLTSMNPYTGSPKPTVSWTLQSKGVIFGDGNFSMALERRGELEVRNHRVYGPSTH